jgi:hypothetical protein
LAGLTIQVSRHHKIVHHVLANNSRAPTREKILKISPPAIVKEDVEEAGEEKRWGQRRRRMLRIPP